MRDRSFVRSAQFGIALLGQLTGVGDSVTGLRWGPMNMDAILTLFSFAGFAALFVSWIMAPMRADVPTNLPVAEAAQTPTAVAA